MRRLWKVLLIQDPSSKSLKRPLGEKTIQM